MLGLSFVNSRPAVCPFMICCWSATIVGVEPRATTVEALKPEQELKLALAYSRWELCPTLLGMPQSPQSGSISVPEFAFYSNRQDIPREAGQSPSSCH